MFIAGSKLNSTRASYIAWPNVLDGVGQDSAAGFGLQPRPPPARRLVVVVVAAAASGSPQVRSSRKLQHRPSSPSALTRQQAAGRAAVRRSPAPAAGRRWQRLVAAARRRRSAAAAAWPAAFRCRDRPAQGPGSDSLRPLRSSGPWPCTDSWLWAALEAAGFMKWSWFYTDFMPKISKTYADNVGSIFRIYMQNMHRGFQGFADVGPSLCESRWLGQWL